MSQFKPPDKITSDGIEYDFIKDFMYNIKGERLSERCYLYRQTNKFDKGKECPFPLSQLKWMIANPNYSTEK